MGKTGEFFRIPFYIQITDEYDGMKDGKNGFIEHTTMMIIIALCLRRQHNSKRLSHWVGSTLTPTQYFACLNYRLMLVNR